MAAYPTTPGFKTNSIRPLMKVRPRPAESGLIRGSSLASSYPMRITITHPLITAAEMATLRTWWDTNKDSDNTLIARGITYDVNVETDYDVSDERSPTYENVGISFIGTRQ